MISGVRNVLEINHGDNSPLRSMEGLRGLAVFLVFLVHYSTLVNPWLSGNAIILADFIHDFSGLGVDLFFVLSGYLIYGSIISKNTFSIFNYSKRRMQRIYPTFLVVFLLYLVLSFLFPSESKLPAQLNQLVIYIVQNLFLLPGVFKIDPIITVAWSLSYEVLYYILIPCSIFGLAMKSWGQKTRLIFWIAVCICGFIYFYYVSGPVRLMMFISGVLLFELHVSQKVTLKSGGTHYLLLAFALFGLGEMYEFNHVISMFLVFILFLATCLNAFNTNSFTYQWLTYTPLRWLGNMSYSYYLIHGLTLKFSFLVFQKIAPENYTSDFLFFWLWIPLFVLTTLASICLFVVVEKPFSLTTKKTTNNSPNLAKTTPVDYQSSATSRT